MSSRSSYMPSRQAAKIQWAKNLSSVLADSAAAYGVPTTTATAFAALVVDLEKNYNAALAPATRTKAAVKTKDDTLRAMEVSAAGIVSLIQGTPSVTDEQKILAGLTVRGKKPEPAPVPPTCPFLKILGVDQRRVTLQLQQDAIKRGKPAKVKGATIFTSVNGTHWDFATNTTKTTVTIPFPPSATGDTVYITAFWSNSRDESGPAADPVKINLPAGGDLPQPVQADVRIAA